MGRHLPRRWLRLLRARLLGVRPARNRAPTQLVRALWPGPAGSTLQNEGWRLALLLRARARRHLHRQGAHGPRASLREPRRDRQPGTLELREPACRRPARRPLTASVMELCCLPREQEARREPGRRLRRPGVGDATFRVAHRRGRRDTSRPERLL